MLIPNQSNTLFSYTLPDGSTQTETRLSNIVNTEIITYSFTKVKTSNQVFLQEGDEAIQTVTLNNTSLLTISNIYFTDTMSSGATYVSGSVSVNGISQPSYNPATGFPLANLAVGNSTTVEFDVTVN